jgi:hypothetical protein
MQAVCSSGIYVNFYQTSRRHIPVPVILLQSGLPVYTAYHTHEGFNQWAVIIPSDVTNNHTAHGPIVCTVLVQQWPNSIHTQKQEHCKYFICSMNSTFCARCIQSTPSHYVFSCAILRGFQYRRLCSVQWWDDRWVMSMVGSGLGLIEVLSQHLHGGNEENRQEPQSV